MNKGISRIYIVFFFFVLLSTAILLVVLLFKTGEIPVFWNNGSSTDMSQNEGYVLPGQNGRYSPVGYSQISDDGKILLLVGELLSIKQENNSITGTIGISLDKKSIISVVFASDASNNKFNVQEQKTDDLFPNSADYAALQLTGPQLEQKLNTRIGDLFVFYISRSDSECNQKFVDAKSSGSEELIECNLDVGGISYKVKE
ncbi:MAG: hypothetical protein KBG10_06995 [Anaerolineaceae bacterium]|nr:hypothetical protein [Anaerolineaceae bacterium]